MSADIHEESTTQTAPKGTDDAGEEACGSITAKNGCMSSASTSRSSLHPAAVGTAAWGNRFLTTIAWSLLLWIPVCLWLAINVHI